MRKRTWVNLEMERPPKIKIGKLVAASILLCAACAPAAREVSAENCPSLKIIFARGSGEERWNNPNYLEFKNTIEQKLKTVDLDYEFIDLDYSAIGVGLDRIGTTLGAFFGSGDAYEFGESVDDGVQNLTNLINSSTCQNTKYVIGGYSQGAMVVSKSLDSINSDRLIYAATFGDPKIYLPEGGGLMPPACQGGKLSEYRVYVPDCQAHRGLLGAYIPYRPEVLTGKVGTWCNGKDVFCSSHMSIDDHTSYVSDNLYEDASRVIFDKITKWFGLKNTVSSPHDTAILIDSTGSMASMIDKYKAEAMRLAQETLDSGGRVALFDYRDLADPYDLVQHCNFVTCTMEKFSQELEGIEIDGGGDDSESLLSASFHAMTSLNWKQGSTKSLVILTDANFLAPDRDGMTFDEVVQLSKRIDPVNFYIITNTEYGDDYQVLAEATDGRVVTDFDELSLLTNYIMERYDSLPKVEETSTPRELPTLTIDEVSASENSKIHVKFTTNGSRTLVSLNGKILGMTDGAEFILGDVDTTKENVLVLTPIDGDTKGESVEIKLSEATLQNIDGFGKTAPIETDRKIPAYYVPKAPNTGKGSNASLGAT